MQQVRIFKTVETELSELEKDVNAWIRETGANIISVTGNIAPQSGTRDSTALGLGGSQYAASDIVLIILSEAPEA